MKSIQILSVVALTSILAACGNPDNSNVPVDIVDQNQTISRDNAQMNAKRYANERLPLGDKVVAQSDSTISKSCRYGDGWATVDVLDANMNKVADNTTNPSTFIQLKCQTNGSGKGLYGCLTVAEFKTKDYADEEGRCQNLPSLPKFSSQTN